MYGNIIRTRPSPEPSIEITLSGPSSAQGSSSYSDNGIYIGTYSVFTTGVYSMVVQVNNQNVVGSPFNNILIASRNFNSIDK